MLAIILTHLGLAVTLLGTLSTLKPLPLLRIRSRRRGSSLAGIGIALTVIGLLAPAGELSVSRPVTALDGTLPTWQFHERHTIDVTATPERVYLALKAVEADEIRFFRSLVWLRRLGRPGPESILNPRGDRPLLEVAASTTFALLADTPREVLIGTVVAAPSGYVRDRAPRASEILEVRGRTGFAVAALTFIVSPLGSGKCRVTTETRVFAGDPATRRRFAAYWRLIYPGSALIRRMWLRAIRDRAEQGM